MSARFVLSQLSSEKFEVIQIGITRQGDWYIGAKDQTDVLDAMLEGDLSGLTPALILPVPARQGIYSLGQSEQLELLSEIDVVFPVLHGTFGEDGTLQGLLEMADLAYVGPGVTGSAVGMDKAVFFDVMRANGVPVVETVLVLRSELEQDKDAVLARVEAELGTYPMFIKPANLGSSVGISKADSRADLLEGLLEAAAYDRRVVVQRGLNVREIEVSVMGNDNPLASVCGEVFPGAEFYSYDAKYHDTGSKTMIPADIPEDLSKRIRELAVQAYKACDLAGLARVDFFLDKDSGEIFLNELNTIPGFTKISMYPMLWEASGVPNQELVEKLVAYALERKAQRDTTKRTFERNE
jgi:D-alanine-D-alanine ligase